MSNFSVNEMSRFFPKTSMQLEINGRIYVCELMRTVVASCGKMWHYVGGPHSKFM